MRSWQEQCQDRDTVWATNVGLVTRNLLDRLIGLSPRPCCIRIHPSVRHEPNLQGVQLYADLLVIYDETCPTDSIYIISDEVDKKET